jgi:hypothetical protein
MSNNKPSQAKPSQAKPSQAKPSQFNLNCLAQYWQKWSFFGRRHIFSCFFKFPLASSPENYLPHLEQFCGRDTEHMRCKQVCCLALLMSAWFAKKGAKFDHVVDFDRYDFLVELYKLFFFFLVVGPIKQLFGAKIWHIFGWPSFVPKWG